jgi:PhoH-like ATPase
LEKLKVIDTNVIVHDPYCLAKISGKIVLTSTVLGELDNFKKSNDERARNVREFTRQLEKAQNVQFEEYSSDLFDDVALDNDYKIIQVAKRLDAILVTNDLLMGFRAIAEGLEVEKHTDSKVEIDQYTGIVEGNALQLQDSLNPNEYVNNGQGKIDRWTGKQFVGLGKDPSVWGLTHKNLEQRCAIDALLDDKIKLVTISGKAGTGKTLLALAAALEKTITDNKYARILVARPVVPMGNDIGYLPGDMKEKLGPWMQPIMDNLEYLFQKDQGTKSAEAYADLEANGIIKIEPLMYIRGRTIPMQFMIIDEAQNLTKHEVKTIISRAGEGTKIVLTGDPDQIDTPKLDSVNNGLSYVIDKFKNQKIAAHVTLTKGERSELADIASEIL